MVARLGIGSCSAVCHQQHKVWEKAANVFSFVYLDSMRGQIGQKGWTKKKIFFLLILFPLNDWKVALDLVASADINDDVSVPVSIEPTHCHRSQNL